MNNEHFLNNEHAQSLEETFSGPLMEAGWKLHGGSLQISVLEKNKVLHKHADWNIMIPTDLIFNFFILAAGSRGAESLDCCLESPRQPAWLWRTIPCA